MKRGQATIFVILGIVILVSFGFLLFARSLVITDQLKAQANEIATRAIESNNINFYVEGCLDRVSEDAAYLMSLQGGKLYTYQGGLNPNPYDPNTAQGDPKYSPGKYYHFIDFGEVSLFNTSFYGSANVGYGILSNEALDCDDFIPYAPDYPMRKVRAENVKDEFASKSANTGQCGFFTGAFGINKINPLCEIDGLNDYNFNLPSEYSPAQFIASGTCDQYNNLNADPNIEEERIVSHQKNLDTYITNKLKNCANFTLINELGFNTTVLNEPVTETIFGKESFIINATYPFIVRIGPRNVRTEVTFSIVQDIRLKELYEYIFKIAELEYKDISFNILDDSKDVALGWDDNIDVELVPNFCTSCTGTDKFDNLIQIADTKSRVRGGPLVYNLIIENRRPMFQPITGTMAADIVVKEGNYIDLTPVGFEPDEGDVEYIYEKWQEDYTEVFDETGFDQCLLTSTEADCYSRIDEFISEQAISDNSEWTNSQPYISNSKDARYLTSRKDIGEHTTRITVDDNEGLVDFQDIKIMVIDTPIINPSTENDYVDSEEFISKTDLSIEDRFTLDAEEKSYFSAVERFIWRFYDDPTATLGSATPVWIKGDDEIIITSQLTQPDSSTNCFRYTGPLAPSGVFVGTGMLPDISSFTCENPISQPFSVPLIEYIDQRNFTRAELGEGLLSVEGIFSINAETTDSTEEKGVKVNIYECLPNRNNVPPYPYNNIGDDNGFARIPNQNSADPDDWTKITSDSGDNFVTNHVCCSAERVGGNKGANWGTILPSSQVCYYYEESGPVIAFRQKYAIESGVYHPDKMDEIDDKFREDEYYAMDRYDNPQTLLNRAPIGQNIPSKYPYDTNVYVLKFDRSCGGDRGNVCSGDFSAARWETIDCNTNTNEGPNEWCRGPSRNYARTAANAQTLGEVAGCENYDRTTFQEVFNLDDMNGNTATGECNKVPACSEIDDYDAGYSNTNELSPNFNPRSIYYCTATCDGSGACSVPDLSRCGITPGTKNCRDYEEEADETNTYCEERGVAGCGPGGCADLARGRLDNTCTITNPSESDPKYDLKIYQKTDRNGEGKREYCNGNAYTNVDRLTMRSWCDTCGLSWDSETGTKNDGCCGDEPGEVLISTGECCGAINGQYAITTNSNSKCCSNARDCIYSDTCYSEGTQLDINGDTYLDSCLNNDWIVGSAP